MNKQETRENKNQEISIPPNLKFEESKGNDSQLKATPNENSQTEKVSR